MRTCILAGKTVKLYDSIDELPIENFQRYNKYVLIDAGLGSDINDVYEHVVNTYRLVDAGEKEKAKQELQNLSQAISMVVSETSPKNLAFAALVHSVDGVKNTDLSDDHLKEMIADFNTEPQSLIDDILEFVKKKFVQNLKRTTRKSS